MVDARDSKPEETLVDRFHGNPDFSKMRKTPREFVLEHIQYQVNCVLNMLRDGELETGKKYCIEINIGGHVFELTIEVGEQ
jgi:hypothetical protein